MASFSDRISVLIDVTTDKATTALGNFRKAVGEADGAGGKLKAGFASAAEGIRANAGMLAMTAGPALIAFGVKAVGAFTDTAKAAIDLGKATGLSTEEASRWIAVADDYEVSAETLTASIGKISRSLDDTKWAEYGIETRDAAGNARSANDILLDTLDVLGKTTNETERARIGTELFGRGYAGLAPIIGETRAEYEQMLGSIEDGQVITEEEAEKAEKFRLAQDKLADALGEVTLAVGELVAGMAPMLDKTADAVALFTTLDEKMGLLEKTASLGNPFAMWDQAMGAATTTGKSLYDMTRNELIGALDDVNVSVGDLAEISRIWAEKNGLTKESLAELRAELGIVIPTGITGLFDTLAGHIGDVGDEADDAADSTDDLRTSFDLLKESIDEDQAWIDLQDQFVDLREKAETAFIAAASGSANAEQAARDYQTEINNTKLEVMEYLQEVLKLPDDEITKIIAEIDWASVDSAEAVINNMARAREVSIVPRPSASLGTVRPTATGGPVLPGNTYEVGELGRERLTMAGSGAGVVSPSSAPAQQLDPAAFGREAAVEFARVLRQQMRAS